MMGVHGMEAYADGPHTPGVGVVVASKASRLPQVHVATLGARQHYAVPKVLQRAGMLGRFYTDIYMSDGSWAKWAVRSLPRRWLPRDIERLLGRFDGELDARAVVSFPAFGIWYLWRRHRVRNFAGANLVHARAARAFNRRIARKGLPGADVIVGHNGAAVELFEFAKKNRIRCVLDQTIAPRAVLRAELAEESRRWPGWEPALCTEEGDGMLERREQAEWDLADAILAPSPYVAAGLRQVGAPVERIRVVPYGIPLERFPLSRRCVSSPPTRLRVLFAGEVGLRKGVPYLLEALRLLNSTHIDARFAGPVALSSPPLQTYRKVATFLGPVPRSQMVDLYQWADLLVCLSICEGSALVTYEALASGIPVVATPNTGAYVRDGVDGITVPIRDAEAIAEVLDRFARDRDLLRSYSHSALSGRERLGLDAYQARFVGAVMEAACGHVSRSCTGEKH